MKNLRLFHKLFSIAATLSLMPGLACHAAHKPLKVFILAGQSNMEGHGGVQTLDQLGKHPTHGHLLKKIQQADGSFVVRDEVRAYQKAKKQSDLHVCNWYCHYQGSARVYCMVGYSLAEAMKPLLATKRSGI